MVKNDINIQPSKGISIIIKNDIQQQEAPKPKKKRKYKRRNLKDLLKNIPPIPNGLISSSVGDTSYIRPPLSYQQFRDIITQPGYQMGLQLPQLPAPPPQLQLPPPPQQLQLPPPPVTINNNMNPGDWYKYLMMPQAFTNEPERPTIEDVTNDPLYNALSYDPVKQEEYKDQKLEEKSEEIINKAKETVANIEGEDFYKKLPLNEQEKTKDYIYYNDLDKHSKQMHVPSIKGLGTKHAKLGKDPIYTMNEHYRTSYLTVIKKLISEQEIINKNTGGTTKDERKAARNEIKRLVDVMDNITTENELIQKILENK